MSKPGKIGREAKFHFIGQKQREPEIEDA